MAAAVGRYVAADAGTPVVRGDVPGVHFHCWVAYMWRRDADLDWYRLEKSEKLLKKFVTECDAGSHPSMQFVGEALGVRRTPKFRLERFSKLMLEGRSSMTANGHGELNSGSFGECDQTSYSQRALSAVSALSCLLSADPRTCVRGIESDGSAGNLLLLNTYGSSEANVRTKDDRDENSGEQSARCAFRDFLAFTCLLHVPRSADSSAGLEDRFYSAGRGDVLERTASRC